MKPLALWAARFAPIATALVVALLLAVLFALVLGVAPGEMFSLVGSRFGAYAWGQVLYKATFLIFTGLAVALAFAGGLFNIGAEGQAVVGALACALVGIALAPLPAILLLPLSVAGAFLGGGLWGLIPGWLKARWGTHEVINTIMLNFIALALSNFLIARWLGLPETVRTAEVGAGAVLARLDGLVPAMRGAAINLSLLLAVACAVAAHLFLFHTRAGLELRAVGLGRRQAWMLGVDPGRRTMLAFFLAGGMAGLVGTNFVLGYKHYYEDGFSGGIGFLGIAVALLARNRPLMVIPAAILFGILSQAGLLVNTVLPRELVDILTGAILLVFIAGDRLSQRWVRRRIAALALAGEGRMIAVVLFTLLAQAVRISVPYGLAAVGGVCSERSGVVNIALEGILLLGAFFAVVGTHFTGSPWIGVAAALAGGMAAAALHALATVTLKADQIVSGLAINIIAFGATRAGLRVLFHSASNSPRIPAPAFPLLPIVLLLIVGVLFLLWRTGLGLALRTAGEHPEAAHSAGFSVARLRWLGVLLSGLLGGLGGAWLAFEQHSFSDQMSGGRGYIALAAMIVGKWHPLGAAAACLFFGAAETAQIRLQGAGAPTQILQALPFLLTILILVFWVGRSVAPAAVGRPYDPEQES